VIVSPPFVTTLDDAGVQRDSESQYNPDRGLTSNLLALLVLKLLLSWVCRSNTFSSIGAFVSPCRWAFHPSFGTAKLARRTLDLRVLDCLNIGVLALAPDPCPSQANVHRAMRQCVTFSVSCSSETGEGGEVWDAALLRRAFGSMIRLRTVMPMRPSPVQSAKLSWG
jgi:hypothetical protein